MIKNGYLAYLGEHTNPTLHDNPRTIDSLIEEYKAVKLKYFYVSAFYGGREIFATHYFNEEGLEVFMTHKDLSRYQIFDPPRQWGDAFLNHPNYSDFKAVSHY